MKQKTEKPAEKTPNAWGIAGRPAFAFLGYKGHR